MKILNVAYELAEVSPRTVGGAEQILRMLDAGITRSGHESVVVALAGSQVSGRLAATTPPMMRAEPIASEFALEAQRRAITDVLAAGQFDIVHMHGLHFHRVLPEAGIPVLVTLHMMPQWYPQDVLWPRRPLTFINCVSEYQRRAFPQGMPLLTSIMNGVEIPTAPSRRVRGGYVAALGRICREKGFDITLQAATRASIPLVIAGRLDAAASDGFFADEIEPHLGSLHRVVDALDPVRRHSLLGGARCLVAASRIPETSSLVAMESMACGTPVVAFRSGAMAEIVDHGATGFLVESIEEMSDAIREVATLDRSVCRSVAIERFSEERMVKDYLQLYGQLAEVGIAVRNGRTSDRNERVTK